MGRRQTVGRVRRAIVVTPALRYGSWSWFEDIIRHSPDVQWTVVGYGRGALSPSENVRLVTLSGGNYLRIGRLAARPWLLWLNFLYMLPLSVIAFVLARRIQPDVVVGNGIAASVLVSPCRWISRADIWLGYHGYISHLGRAASTAIAWCLSGVSGAVCNSAGSAQEMRSVMRGRPVIAVEHWADETFFEGSLPDREPRRGMVDVLYVGRTDAEKFGQCRRVCMALAKEGLVALTVVGPREEHVDGDGIRYVGYISSRDALKKCYQEVDVTWAPADVDYLSRPGVESLASGCPILISDIPAVEGKCDGSIRIPRNLVPPHVGRVLDGVDDEEALSLLRAMGSGRDRIGDRNGCRRYAQERYSPRNIDAIIDAWFSAPGGAGLV